LGAGEARFVLVDEHPASLLVRHSGGRWRRWSRLHVPWSRKQLVIKGRSHSFPAFKQGLSGSPSVTRRQAPT
jgi:hypothetical protein